MAQAYAPHQTQLGVAVEVTRGTAVAPAFWLPIMDPAYEPKQDMLEDKGLRGSAVDVYDLVRGVRHDELGFKGNVFLDTFPLLLRAALGSTDTTVSAPANTTLASSAAAGATTISTAASIAVGSWIAIGTAGTTAIEAHKTTAVSGAGPYTVTLAVALVNAQSNGATVTGLTGHKIGLLNNASQNQPPSLTLTDYNGEEWRQLAAAQLDQLDIDFNTTLLSYTSKFQSNPSTTPSTPTASFTTVPPVPGWTAAVSIGGSAVTYVTNVTLNLKRSVKHIPALTGTQAPYLLYTPFLSTGGKLTFIEQSGSPQLANYLNGTSNALDLTFYDLSSGFGFNVHLNSVKFKAGRMLRGKEYIEVEADFLGVPNSTDAVAGGLSPIVATVANSTVAAY